MGLFSSAALYGNLLDAALVAATLERRVQESVENLDGRLGGDETRREDQHVGIIVGAGQARQLRRPAQSRTDTLMLVERHGYAVAAAAHGDARVVAAFLYRHGAGMREIGIVAAILAGSAEIVESNPLALQIALENTFELVTGMVAAECRLNARLENRVHSYVIEVFKSEYDPHAAKFDEEAHKNNKKTPANACISKKICNFASQIRTSPGGGMVDALVSGASAARRAGSSPVLGTKKAT